MTGSVMHDPQGGRTVDYHILQPGHLQVKTTS
jgi:hypothetical protein